MQRYAAYYPDMLTLPERIKRLRGERNYVEFAELTGVNRQTLKDIEDGKSVLIETLKKIANACGVDSGEWLSLLTSWIRLQIGEEDFRKLDIRAAVSAVDDRHGEGKSLDFGKLFEFLFRHLTGREQVEIFKAMTSPLVRDWLSNISRLLEKQDHDHIFKEICRASHPVIDSPEKVQSVLQKLEEGDDSLFAGSKPWAVKCALSGGARSSLRQHSKGTITGQSRRG